MWASSHTVRYIPTSPMLYEIAFGLARTLFLIGPGGRGNILVHLLQFRLLQFRLLLFRLLNIFTSIGSIVIKFTKVLHVFVEVFEVFL